LDLPPQALEIEESSLVFDKVLGKGAFGEVRRYQWCGIWFAVKVSLLAEYEDPQAREQFYHELSLMARLNHPNIVRLCAYTKAPDNKIPMLVVECMERGTLYAEFGGRDEKRQSEPLLPYTMRYQIALNIAEGLRYLHHQGIIHRDLKSENVLLCYYQGNPYFAKITDFGLSVMQENNGGLGFRTLLSPKPEGTLSILAPEILGGREAGVWRYTPKTDIYSFALILWELMKYEMAYKGHTHNTLADFVIKGGRELIPQIAPEKFREATEKGWAQLPENRPDMDTLITLLRAGLRAEAARENVDAEVQEEFGKLSDNRFSSFGSRTNQAAAQSDERRQAVLSKSEGKEQAIEHAAASTL
jgi:serine/threonine protein kinase